MASVQDIKRRVRSVRNTRKITKAMELVAGAKLRRAATRIEAMRPYADRMLELMTGTARASASVRGLPLLQRARGADRADRPVHRRPWPGRRASTRRSCVMRSRWSGGSGPKGRRCASRSSARRAPRPCASAATSWTASSRASPTGPTYGDAQADRAPARRAVHGRGRGPGDRDLQPLHLAARPAGDRAGGPADLRAASRARGGGRRRRSGRRSATSSTSPSRRRSSPGCCPSTSRPSCTARCSSRRRPSRARA